ncbi:DUF554 domain-containing protein [Lapidilactobacillus mulanensis]|uniref:DUF554 domain-containing protein n=1 Tax=Lapidilactobacillus mulanensis TaxID=2485999 RepID=A0ABW4DRI4_9LACO|nr:DUF554 domain-containing protein [Lapidilactobacillus mulanensis]
MPIGVTINALSVLFGGIFGALGGKHMSKSFKDGLNMVFGACSMTMGIFSIAPMKNMSAVIFSVIIGTGIGLAFHLGDKINRAAKWMQNLIVKLFPRLNSSNSEMSAADFDATLVTVIVLFCASGTGIYGALSEGMSGDTSILISKSILDFFTAAIFAANLGYVVSLISVPQFVIFGLLFMFAGLIFPLTTPTMILDFKAVGGVLMLATGFRMVKLLMFPTADMIPAMIVALPLSWVWINWIGPLL